MYKQILFAMLCVLVLGACQPPASSVAPTNSSTPMHAVTATPTPLPPGIFAVQLSPTFTPTPIMYTPTVTDLIIVLDGSRSMKKCTAWLYPGDQDLMAQKIVQFFYTLFDPAKVRVHVIYLPSKDANIMFVPLNPDGFIQLKPVQSSDNHYVSAFEAIQNQFAENYVVLMISDGTFNEPGYTGERETAQKWLRDNEIFRSHLYAIQPASNVYDFVMADQNMWHAELGDQQHMWATERQQVGTLLQNMINGTSLKEALPTGGRFVGDEPETVPGKAFQVPSKIWGVWDKENDVSISIDGAITLEPSVNLSLSKPTPIPPHLDGPVSGCKPHAPLLHTYPIIAYYLMESIPVDSLLEISTIQFATGTRWQFDDNQTAEKNVIWNPKSLNISKMQGVFNALGGDAGVSAYKECYFLSAELKFVSDIGEPDLPYEIQVNTPFHEFFKNELQNVDANHPVIPLGKPGSISLQVFLHDRFTKEDKIVKTWITEKIYIRFYPQLADEIPAPDLKDEKYYEFRFPFVNSACQYYTGQTGSCLSQINVYDVVYSGGKAQKVYGLEKGLLTGFIPTLPTGIEEISGDDFIFRDENNLEIILFIKKDSFAPKSILIMLNENTPAYLCSIESPDTSPKCHMPGVKGE